MSETAELKFVEFNPHPRGLHVKDCVKRAICVATGEDYKKVKRDLNYTKNNLAPGCKTTKYDFNDPEVIETYTRLRGWKQVTLKPNYDTYMYHTPTVREFFEQGHQKGIYMFNGSYSRRSGHLCTMRDGVIYDTWDSRDIYIKDYWIIKEA